MNFEPQRFFVGLVDFFAILMPGALLTYLGKEWAQPFLPMQEIGRLDSAGKWVVFLFASYLLGHFCFLLGALLDDWLYDPLRTSTYLGQIRRLARGKEPPRRALQALAGAVFGSSADAAVIQAQRIKARALQSLSAEHAINAYQWCKARLSKDHPEGLLAVERFEAGSKFFRSLVVVLALLALIYAAQGNLIAVVVCLAGLALALWRYMDQRFKATQQAYWFIITLEALKPTSMPSAGQRQKSNDPTHAGDVVCRRQAGSIEYLLVQASNDRSQWVLPKGHIEPGEDPRETAVRELHEETGHWARVLKWIDDVRLEANTGNDMVVRFYCMESTDRGTQKRNSWPAENRGHQWLPLAEAKRQATFPETRELLDRAEMMLVGRPPNTV